MELQGHSVSRHYIACAQENAPLLDSVVDQLNRDGLFDFVSKVYSDEDVIRFTAGLDFGLVLPKSEMSLNRIEDELTRRLNNPGYDAFDAKAEVGYSPVVFLVNPAAADRLKLEDEPMTWGRLVQSAETKGTLRIRHASPRQLDGEIVALAQHLAMRANGDNSNSPQLNEQLIQQQVEEYGPDDREVLERAVSRGWKADVVIAQERSVIDFARTTKGVDGIVMYPHDGILALSTTVALSAGWNREGSREAFEQLAEGLAKQNGSALAVAGLHKSVQGLTSAEHVLEFASGAGVPSSLRWAPHSGGRTLILPSRPAIRGIRDLSLKNKRSLDVCLVFDSSESMREQGKFEAALSGIDAFLKLIDSSDARVSLIRIQSTARLLTPLLPRDIFSYQRNWLSPDGRTALIDAVNMAVQMLATQGGSSSIQAIVGFTDGQENVSALAVDDVEAFLKSNPRIRFYGIAYGLDADSAILDRFATASDGLVVQGGPSQIEVLFKRLSTYV